MLKNKFILFIVCFCLFHGSVKLFSQNNNLNELMKIELLKRGIDKRKAEQMIKDNSNEENPSQIESIIGPDLEPNSEIQNTDRVMQNIEALNDANVSISSENNLLDNQPENNSSIDLNGYIRNNDNPEANNLINNENNNQNDIAEESETDENTTDDVNGYYDIKNDYFGYNIFNQNPEYFQESVEGSVDPNYLVGPGDEIIIMLWGDTELNRSYFITKDGYLFIQNVGQVYVNGLTIEKVEKKLFKILKKVYSSLDSSNKAASTYFDVSLGSVVLKPLRIFVLGEVRQPGAYNVKRTSSLFSSLFYFNGPTIKGSLREINLIRKGNTVATIDYYDYLLSGKKIKDIRLQNDDVVFIPPRGKTVKISGEINRPSIYELRDNEDLKDLLQISSGLKPSAYMDRIQINRIIPFKKRKKLGINRTIVDVSLNDLFSSLKRFDLYNGDEIIIFPIFENVQNVVTINGSVKRPGDYDLANGLTLIELVNKSDGFLGDVYLNKANIIRDEFNNAKTQISVSLEKALNGDPEHNIPLQPNDIVEIFNRSDMIEDASVLIRGQVINRGFKEFIKGMTLSDLVFLGGGLEDEQRLSRVYLERADLIRDNEFSNDKELITFRLDSLLAGKGMSDLNLKINDEVYIYSKEEIFGLKEQFVEIIGNVKRPGRYPLLGKNMTLKDLIFKYGGFDDQEYLSNTYLKRAELLRGQDEKGIFIPFSLDSVLSGKGRSDILIQNNDKVRIYSNLEIYGQQDSTVTIRGYLKRPGSYQLTSNMKISDLLFSSGGFQDKSYYERLFSDRADISRLDSAMDRKTSPFNVGAIIDSPGGNDDFNLKPGDEITLYSREIFNLEKYVEINGDIAESGRFQLLKNMTLNDLILSAGGVDLGIRSFIAEIARLNPNNIDTEQFAEIIRIPINNDPEIFSIKSKNNKKDLILMPYDLITIRRDPFFQSQKSVSVTGEVFYPGDYILAGPYDKVTDIISRAGGITENAHPIASQLIRDGEVLSLSFERILKNPRSRLNFIIQEGDSLIIGKKTNMVKIIGGVNSPGNYQYLKGKKLDSYIKLAGGFNPEASRWNTFVKYPNGISRKIKIFSLTGLPIVDGSEIYVGLKEEIEPFSFTEYVAQLTSIYADFTQAVLMIRLVGSQ